MFFCFFFLIIDLSVLISTVLAQILSSTAELEITTGITTKEAKTEMETQSVIVEDKIISIYNNSVLCKSFCAFYLSINYASYLLKENFLSHLFF